MAKKQPQEELTEFKCIKCKRRIPKSATRRVIDDFFGRYLEWQCPNCGTPDSSI